MERRGRGRGMSKRDDCGEFVVRCPICRLKMKGPKRVQYIAGVGLTPFKQYDCPRCKGRFIVPERIDEL